MNTAVALSGAKMVVLTAEEYEALIEDAGDTALAREAMGGPTMPQDIAGRMLSGDLHPLAAWRMSLGLSQTALAEKAGVRAATVSDIEAGKIDPRVSTVKALAEAIGVEIGDLVR